MKAAERKNCSAYAHYCDDSDQFVYHCVIDPHLSQAVEVCTISVKIVGGYCAEYSKVGSRIQPNYNAPCQKCPKGGYRSREAFRFSECYDLLKTSAGKIHHTTSILPNITDVANADFPDNKKTNSEHSKHNPSSILYVIVPFMTVVSVSSCFT
uniref:Uncharacterized protein LOC111101106 n=1 Tax=Crassostrea virginica TaxID=6565 RepID=A0A8B8AGL1_CRAVI|nr:uncharacterized protein LOC111101106 [Crassostrea virginica]